jgi:PAS domain S-box-containing protein
MISQAEEKIAPAPQGASAAGRCPACGRPPRPGPGKTPETHPQLAARVIEVLPEGIMITAADGVILQVNPAFTRITGYAAAEVLGRKPRLLYSGSQGETFYRQLRQTLKRDGRWQGEIRNRRKSGDIYPQWLSIRVLRDRLGRTVP